MFYIILFDYFFGRQAQYFYPSMSPSEATIEGPHPQHEHTTTT